MRDDGRYDGPWGLADWDVTDGRPKLAICGNCNEPTGSDVAPSPCDICHDDVCQHCGTDYPDGAWSQEAHHACIETVIGAAPTMLEVLLSMRVTLPGLDGDKGDIFDRVKAVIAKAKGDDRC